MGHVMDGAMGDWDCGGDGDQVNLAMELEGGPGELVDSEGGATAAVEVLLVEGGAASAAAAVEVLLEEGGAAAENTCVIGQRYQVNCNESYLGAKPGMMQWPDIDSSTVIADKLDFTPVAGNSVCNHHVNELSHTDPSRRSIGKCNGFGRNHVKTVMCKVLTCENYFNGLSNNEFGILPGMFVCNNCMIGIRSKKASAKRKQDEDTDFIGDPVRFTSINQVLMAAGIEPLVADKLSADKLRSRAHSKLKALLDSCITLLRNDNVLVDYSITNDKSKEIEKIERNWNEVMQELKLKYSTSDYKQKVQVLTVVPSSWSALETVKFFSSDTNKCSISHIRKARKLKELTGILSIPSPRKGKGLSVETLQLVSEFYYDDTNSRQLPGMKDTVSVLEGGTRTRKAKKVILGNLKDLHRCFIDNHGSQHKISFSKFCSLRPREFVLASAKGVHNVCVCTYHGNVNTMLEAIHQGKEFRTSLMNSLVCEFKNAEGVIVRNDDCMLGLCKKCERPNPVMKNVFRDLIRIKLEEQHISDKIEYSYWITKTKHTELQECVSDIDSYIDNLFDEFVTLLPHHFLSGKQAEQFKCMRSPDVLSESTAVVQVDFAENYSFVVQDEPQSFHWETLQATIHPIVVWLKVNGEVKSVSIAIISDETRHDTETVYGFQHHFLLWLKSKYPQVNHIEYWSDGCGGQYKNHKNFRNLHFHFSDFGLTASWNFFASYHGKGAVDGVAAVIKSQARSHSLKSINKGHILTPRALFDYCEPINKKITCLWVTSQDVSFVSDTMSLQTRFNASSTIPQTRMAHKVQPFDASVKLFRTSADLQSFFPVLRVNNDNTSLPPQTFDYEVGDWVAAKYSVNWYLGIVSDRNDEVGLFKINFVDKPGSPLNSYRFSTNVELNSAWVKSDDILNKVSPTTGNRARTSDLYSLTKPDQKMTEKNFHMATKKS